MRIFRIIRTMMAAGVLTVVTAPVSMAQTQLIGEHGDWSVFTGGEGESRICWVASSPTKKTALRGGKTVQVNRGDILLMVSIRPADGVRNEVSYTSGYPFKPGSEVEVAVGSRELAMFTGDGNLNEVAWLTTPEEDNTAVSRFRAGANARIKGVSARGTTTIDTFSLKGFTAAMKAASDKCKS